MRLLITYACSCSSSWSGSNGPSAISGFLPACSRASESSVRSRAWKAQTHGVAVAADMDDEMEGLKQLWRTKVIDASMFQEMACERVFSLLDNLFGEQQTKSLADCLQAALMLNYNGRKVG